MFAAIPVNNTTEEVRAANRFKRKKGMLEALRYQALTSLETRAMRRARRVG
jgi:hypothetical protein